MVLRRVTFGVLVSAILLAPGAQASATTAPARTAIVYGDSLLWETKRQLLRQLRGTGPMRVVVRAVPAAVPCDWFAQLRVDLARKHPSLVMMESSGLTSLSRCMISPSTGRTEQAGSVEWMAKSSADLDWFFGSVTATGARATFIAPPPASWTATLDNEAILAIALRDAAEYRGAGVDVGPALAVTADGSYATQLPCLPGENARMGCTGGRITVRSTDGIHFCPKPIWPKGCPVYSSGEARFGGAVARLIEAS